MAWLAIFFLVPLGVSSATSRSSRGRSRTTSSPGSSRTSATRSPTYREQLLRSFLYAGIATVVSLLLAYPLVYWIAFRGGRWRNLFLLFIVAPFFVTYLIRTLAWLNILADEGPVVGLLRELHLLGEDEGLLYTTLAVVAGITYNFFPFMALPLYVSLEQIDARLLEAAKDLSREPHERVPPRHAAALRARDRRGHAAHVHPRRRRLHQRRAARDAEAADDRQRDPGEVPRVARLPAAASLSFVLMAAILVALLVYARLVGTEKLTG